MPATTPTADASRPASLPLLRRASRHLRSAMAALLVSGAALSSIACGGTAPPPAETAAEQRGPAGVLRLALEDLDLEGGTRAAALAVADDLHAATEPVRAEQQRVAAALGDRIAAGTLTRADIDAAVADLDKAGRAAVPAFQSAANRLHALLDEEQREDLLDALRDAGRARFHGEGGPRERMKQLAEDLELTDEQREAIRDKVKEEIHRARAEGRGRFEAARERWKAAAEAFVSDDFDAAALGLGEGLAIRRTFLETKLRVVEAAVPRLSPAQRQKLAAFVRARGDAVDGLD